MRMRIDLKVRLIRERMLAPEQYICMYHCICIYVYTYMHIMHMFIILTSHISNLLYTIIYGMCAAHGRVRIW
jgi:hypothetical protein